MTPVRGDKTDKRLAAVGMLVSCLAAGFLVSIYGFIGYGSSAAWHQFGLEILRSDAWAPLGQQPRLGILTMIASTLWCAVGALLLASPLGVCSAIFLSEVAPPWVGQLMRPVILLLTGIPSVVYGFLGAAVLVTFFEVKLGMASGESLFCGSIVLAVMILPYIISGSYHALQSIPAGYREAASALGVSEPYAVTRVLLPLVYKNIAAAIAIAFGRATGETMAVLMLAGNTLTMPDSWFSKGETLSALIALELGSSEAGSLHHQGLFAAGLVLLALVTAINIGVNGWLSPRREEDGR